MRWFFNMNRLDELFEEEKIQQAARTLLNLSTLPVLKAFAVVWTAVLLMVFTFLLTIRLALSLPL